ncbi:MAG: DNA repair protein RecO [Metamycoplasmataceae bacterium]
MQTKKIIGIIISKSPYLDNDEIISVYTDNSIVRIYAKGVKKIESKNRPNVLIGSLVSFEIMVNYSTKEWFFLKKATIIQYLPSIMKNNVAKIDLILKILGKMKNFNDDIYKTYISLLNNFESVNFYKTITFLISRILKSNGEGLSFQNCVICSSNQNLYSFDVNQGGMLCKKHGQDQWSVELLKSLYAIGNSLEKYIETASLETNKNIFIILYNLLF